MIRYITILSLILLFTSCEKVIKIDVPDQKPQVVINSYTETNDTIQVQVGKTVGVLKRKNGQDYSLANATVTLTSSDAVSEVLKYDIATGLFSGKMIAQAGKSYDIKVSSPDYKDAEATSSVPEKVEISDVKHFSKVRLDIDGNSLDEVRIQFTDPPAAGDYYVIKYIPANQRLDSSYLYGCIYTNDLSVESIYNEDIDINTCLSGDGIFLRDAVFNGTIKELRLFVSSVMTESFTDMNGDTLYPAVQLYHVPEAYFKFQKSYQFATENNGDPFSEPTNVYSNVKNGLGVFSIVSKSSRDIKP